MRTTAALLLVLLAGCQGQPYNLVDGGTDAFDPCNGGCGFTDDGGTFRTVCCEYPDGAGATGWFCAHNPPDTYECVGR